MVTFLVLRTFYINEPSEITLSIPFRGDIHLYYLYSGVDSTGTAHVYYFKNMSGLKYVAHDYKFNNYVAKRILSKYVS